MRSGGIASASVRRVTFSTIRQVGIRHRDALELDEVAEVLHAVEVDADRLPEQQMAFLLDHGEDAEARFQRRFQRRCVVDRDQAIARFPRFVGVDPVVLDERGAPGLFSRSLSRPFSTRK